MNSTCIHEASHCAAAWLLGRDVAYTWREVGSVLPGETAGHARIPIDKLEPSQLVIALIGYLSVDTPDWPPTYEEACTEELEGLWVILLRLHATEEKYDAIVQYTRELLEDPDFIRLRDAIARALARVPRIERETIERLAEIHFNPEPEGEMAWST
ncbi:MAG: hypothetical protein ACXWDP_05635 [Solirubrobacterales bacterium]